MMKNFKSKVIKGIGMGGKLGYKTANLEIEDGFKLEEGVYAALIFMDDLKYECALFFGRRKTLNIDQLSLECHIFDFEDEIYGKKVSVELVQRIRGIIRFDVIEDLKNQIKRDLKEIKFIMKEG